MLDEISASCDILIRTRFCVSRHKGITMYEQDITITDSEGVEVMFFLRERDGQRVPWGGAQTFGVNPESVARSMALALSEWYDLDDSLRALFHGLVEVCSMYVPVSLGGTGERTPKPRPAAPTTNDMPF